MSRQTLANILSDEIRSSSVPPPQISSVNKPSRTQSIPPSRRNHVRSASGSLNQLSRDSTGANPLDLMDFLQRSESSVVKTRSGSVLSRGFILKTDHYPSGVYSFLFVDIVSDITCRSCSWSWPQCSWCTKLQVPSARRSQCLRGRATSYSRTSGHSFYLTLQTQYFQSISCCMVLYSRRAYWYVCCISPPKKPHNFFKIYSVRTYIDFIQFSLTQFIFLVVHLSYVTRLNHDLLFRFLIVPKILKQSKIG